MQQDFSLLGYDPEQTEPIVVSAPPEVISLPPAYSIDPALLPPPGHQSVADCAAWASTYGLATFIAARADGVLPNRLQNQASPAYIYIQVMKGKNPGGQQCTGSSLMAYFQQLANGGTPTLQTAPYVNGCQQLWDHYNQPAIKGDPRFAVDLQQVKAVTAKDILPIKQVLASGNPLVYGTRLYTDWSNYHGLQDPYAGNGIILTNPATGKPAGHCMLIIGYDDNRNGKGGAVCLQNSLGLNWGDNGYVWMAYDTFTTLAQGQAMYYPSPF
ncbi:C1 family peptidase [Chitinophaga oryzae]|uniref:C1 family peptidase n=1 Tax=Chitinophaga oryzae TaxID=2725414 RepID=A0AAE6ZF37_9BACT|nr:C1 family peptidase [Chitinophaga oryzae]QJB31808.1 C1 family peptidase [Chitinophaga oryzae]